MFKIQIRCTAEIEGCPDWGVAAIDWRRAHGLPEAPTNELPIDINITCETLVREFGGGDRSADVMILNTTASTRHYTRVSDRLTIGIPSGDNPVISLEAALTCFQATQDTYSIDWAPVTRELHAQFEKMAIERQAREEEREAERQAKLARDRENDRLRDERREAREAEEARQAAENKAREAKELDVLLDWVANNSGEPEVICDQARERLLSHDAALTILRDAYFAPLDSFTRYQKIKLSNICTCECEYGISSCRLECECGDATELPTPSYATLREIRDTILAASRNDAHVVPRIHLCKTGECNQRVTKFSAKVTGTMLGITISREYAI